MSEYAENRSQERSNSVKDQKEVEFFSVGLNGWMNTRVEVDKSILGLSAGGGGLLATFITASVDISCVWFLLLYAMALFSFVIEIILILRIFRLNSDYLELVIRDKSEDEFENAKIKEREKWLEKRLNEFDTVSFCVFGFAVFCSALFGFFVMWNSYNINQNAMAEKKPKKPVRVMTFDGVGGYGNMRPVEPKASTKEKVGNDNQQNSNIQSKEKAVGNSGKDSGKDSGTGD